MKMEKILTLSITTTDRRFSIRLPEKDCYNRFNEFVRAMTEETGSLDKDDPVLVPVQASPQNLVPHDPPPAEVIPLPGMDGYSGFIHAECKHCGTARGFCSKKIIDTHACRECGKETPLENMVPMFVNCECGKRFKYITNVTAEMFDFPCLDCQAPVTLQYNPKHRQYDTIR